METIRKWTQTVFAFLLNGNWLFPFTRTIYQGPLKIVCAPGLNCYSCPAATTYCPIGSIQQLLAGLRTAVANGNYFVGFYVWGSIGVLGAMFGRLLCGWVCPFGFIQELLHKIPARKFGVPNGLKYIKYLMLAVPVVLLPLLLADEFGNGTLWFCKYICPAGTLEAGLPLLLLQPGLRSSVGVLFFCKLLILVFFIVWSILASRPFCRTTCPLGAFYSLFSKVRLVRLHLDIESCTHCEACHKVCPMGVKFNESPDDTECITCLACMNQACQYGAISLEIGGVALQKSSKSRQPARVEGGGAEENIS